jgi:quinoprotein glucose dehydrogenase
MRRSHRVGLAAIVVCVCAAAIVATARGQDRFRDGAPGEWRYYGGTAASTKYSALDQITRDNVGKLEIAWSWRSPDNDVVKANPQARPGGYEDTPLMVNGVLYTATSLGTFAAIDPETGTTIWQYDPQTWKVGRPGNLGYTHRGVAYWTDGKIERIISGTHDAYLISLDAKTGKPDPSFGINGRVDAMIDVPRAERMRTYAINSAPVIVRNVIIHGANIPDGPPNKEAPPGDVHGFDVRTGKLLWTFHAIPRRGEFGFETWENESGSYSGGTNVWSLMSADEELGYVYLPFGTPTNDYYGGHRPGDNLFAESLVCLDARTGKRVWHFQGVHHGLWDYDFPAAPILVDLTVDGKKIKALAQPSKQGFLYVLDRTNGRPVWPIEERAVPQSTVPGERTAPTQPFPTRPPAFERQGFTEDDVIDFTPEIKQRALEIARRYQLGPLFTPPSEQGTIVLPGHGGGANYGGASFDPDTGMLYVPSVTIPIAVKAIAGDPARGNLKYRHAPALGVPTVDGLLIVKPPYARITAYDLNTGDIRWQVPLGDGPRNHPLLKDLDVGPLGSDGKGHPLLTKSLLFVSLSRPVARAGEEPERVGDRPLSKVSPEPPKFRAFDKKTGALVWEYVMPRQPAATPMTYLHRGRQFIVVAIGAGDDAELIAFSLRSSRGSQPPH